jgi:tetratricopeptide (TPR) repeat protein
VETNILFGFPGETKEYMQETIDYLETVDVDWVQTFTALPLPGTEMFRQFANRGVIDPDNINWDYCGYADREFETEEISKKELTDLTYDVNIYTNFFGNRNILNGRYERAADYITSMVINNYPFHIVALYTRSTAYRNMGEFEKSQEDLETAADYIKSYPESRRLFKRYGSWMNDLHKHLDSEIIEEMLPNPPSVDAGFRF